LIHVILLAGGRIGGSWNQADCEWRTWPSGQGNWQPEIEAERSHPRSPQTLQKNPRCAKARKTAIRRNLSAWKWFRDTAKGLAELRDTEAIIETYDSLLDQFSDQIDRRAFAPIRRALTLRQKKIIESVDLNHTLKKLRARMGSAARRVSDWKLKTEEFEGIEGGLLATYRQARKTMVLAYEEPTAANFHEWRKQAKYHEFHMRLLSGLWKPVRPSVSKETDDLSDLLGDDHNLYVLNKTLLKSPKQYGKKRDIQVLLGLIDWRSTELRVEANTVGTRIFAEKPNAFARRFRGYWKVWRSEAKLPSKKLSEEPAVVTAAAW
jgi:hypothetical protein